MHSVVLQTDTNSESEFQRRKARSMAKMRNKVMATGPGGAGPQVSGNVHVTADIAPMVLDNSVTFESVGGLDDRMCSPTLRSHTLLIFVLLLSFLFSVLC